MGIGMYSVGYLKAGRFTKSMLLAPLLASVLILASLTACQSGDDAQGGLPGLLERVGGQPQRVAPTAAGQPDPGPTAPGQAVGAAPQANIPPTLQAPRPALPADTIETQPLPAAPSLIPPGEGGIIRIGFLAPLSGPSAGLGRALFEAAQLALFDLADDRILLLPRDTGGQPQQAATAAGQLIAEGAQILIGPLFSAETAAIAPVAQARNVKVMSFSTDRGVAGNGVYLLGFTPDQQVARVMTFARSRGLTRFALLAPDSAYGEAVAQAAYATAAQTDAKMLHQERYPGDTADLTPVVRRFATALRGLSPSMAPALSSPAAAAASPLLTAGSELTLSRPVDALLLPEGGARLRALAPLLPFFDIDPRAVKFLGTGLWDDPSLGSEPALVGGWYAGPAPEGFADFARRYQQSFGRRPPRLASLAYDATALAGILARQAGAAAFSDQMLTNPDGFAGYDGIFRFRSDGIVERGLAVLEIQRHGSRVVDPAPASFQPPVN